MASKDEGVRPIASDSVEWEEWRIELRAGDSVCFPRGQVKDYWNGE